METHTSSCHNPFQRASEKTRSLKLVSLNKRVLEGVELRLELHLTTHCSAATAFIIDIPVNIQITRITSSKSDSADETAKDCRDKAADYGENRL